MKWKKPPVIKIYEALGAVADGRIEVDGNAAKVYSSSGPRDGSWYVPQIRKRENSFRKGGGEKEKGQKI
ncbi:MAG: hypothetical protein WAN50_02225 [Minisyncoccia bacterium]